MILSSNVREREIQFLFRLGLKAIEFSDLVALKKKLPNTSFVPLFT